MVGQLYCMAMMNDHTKTPGNKEGGMVEYSYVQVSVCVVMILSLLSELGLPVTRFAGLDNPGLGG